ncbi:hypothetical protein SAZ_33660 [Streptomyces noursei ZPM]|nr:hypothetical protein SAZ_33660 [Streptomyces noursei ZPM]
MRPASRSPTTAATTTSRSTTVAKARMTGYRPPRPTRGRSRRQRLRSACPISRRTSATNETAVRVAFAGSEK